MTRRQVTAIVPADPGSDSWLLFRSPVGVLSASCAADVIPLLDEVERAVAGNLQAVGFLAYEAAPAMDSALQVHAQGAVPLAWFALFDVGEPLPGIGGDAPLELGPWRPSIDLDTYRLRVERIKSCLREGDTYQVNFTMRLEADFAGAPQSLFARLALAQGTACCMYIETPDFALCSASPELFFRRHGTLLESRPMKGTARRGMTCESDERAAAALRRSAKDRAENVMIVDMVRNDMGRIAAAGSVRVTRLFEIERYPTVLQMTSTVACHTDASLSATMRALFPCASITGAPKVRTMQIIRELEASPRGIYTGSIGHVRGPRDAWFNVAIRTAWIDRKAGRAEYGVGGGIVWDSDADREYEECRTKAGVLRSDAVRFELLETMRWERDRGVFLLDLHIGRLQRSAKYFDFEANPDRIRAEIEVFCARRRRDRCVVRVRLAQDGSLIIEDRDIEEGAVPRRVALARSPVDTGVPWLYHKTTRRTIYEEAGNSVPEADDVILWNERGEITEATIANVVVEIDGQKLTPPVSCGLLAGTYREWLLARGMISERVVTKEDLLHADGVYLVNSVRRWMPVDVVELGEGARAEEDTE